MTVVEKSAMSLSVRCFSYAQISFLVTNTNKKNYKANYAEISKVKNGIMVPRNEILKSAHPNSN